MTSAPQTRGEPGKHLRTDHLQPDLEGRAVRGGLATVVSQGVRLLLQLAAIVILARLLAPEDFGAFAMAMAVLAIFEIFRDLGLSVATLQRPDLTHRQVSALFWINLGLGAAAGAIFAALAPALAWFYGNPVLRDVAPAIALLLVLGGLAAQHLALLQRQMRFLTVALIVNGAEILSLAVAVYAALHGLGLWALVIQRLMSGACTAAGAWCACDWRPGRPAPLAEIRSIVAFGGNTMLAMGVGRLAANLDRILLGWYWGSLAVGLFDRAQKLLLAPIQNLHGPLSSVAVPSLSRLADQPDRYRAAYIAAAERLAMIVAPAAALLIAAAEPVIALVLGPDWSAAGPILGWLAITMIYMPLTYTFGWLYLSQDRTGEMLLANIANGSLSVLAMAAGLPFGPVGVAGALAVSGLAIRMPLLCWLVARRGPVGWPELGRVVALPVLATGSAVALLVAARGNAVLAGLPPLGLVAMLAAIAGTVCVAIYATVPRGRRILGHAVRLPMALLRRA